MTVGLLVVAVAHHADGSDYLQPKSLSATQKETASATQREAGMKMGNNNIPRVSQFDG